jgi:hypothetical protein
VHERELRRLVVAVVALLAFGCAPKMTPRQAAVHDAFETCRSQGPSAKLERVDPDGRFSVVGRGADPQRVHDCMVRQDQPAPATARAAAPAVAGGPLLASRLPGTWRGTLTLPPRGGAPGQVASPATVRFAVAGGAIKWTLATASPGSPVRADGTAVVVDGELRMTGSIRPPGPATGGPRPTMPVRYAGTLVGDRLEATGVTGDKQVHVLSIRRMTE